MLIECSIPNCLIFIPFIFPIFFQARLWINKKYIKEDAKFFRRFRHYLSHNLSIIVILIIKFRTMPGPHSSNNILNKNHKSRKFSIWINPLNIEQKKLKKEKKIESIYFLLLLLIISIISNLFSQFFNEEDIEFAKPSLGIFFEIINFILLSVLALNLKLYKHQYFSLGVISFTLLSLIIYLIIQKIKKNILYAFWYYFINSFLYALYGVLAKKYMNSYFDSPYNILLKIGLIMCIILIIYDITLYYFFVDYREKYSGIIFGFKKSFEELNKSFILFFSLSIFFEFLFNIGIWLTIYFFNPCYFIISETISEFILFIYNIISNKQYYNNIEKIIYSICYIFSIISSLIFNEIIIINCFGMSEFTKNNIKERERIDTLNALNRATDSENEINSSFSSDS